MLTYKNIYLVDCNVFLLAIPGLKQDEHDIKQGIPDPMMVGRLQNNKTPHMTGTKGDITQS